MSMGHARLIDSLRQTHRLTDKTANAMLQVDRIWFLDPDNAEARHLAYQASPFTAMTSCLSCLLLIVHAILSVPTGSPCSNRVWRDYQRPSHAC